MQKRDFIWLTKNTDIENVCNLIDDCSSANVVFKVFRPHHIEHIKKIFSDHNIRQSNDQDDFRYVQITDFSLSDLADEARQHHADVIYNGANGKFYYVPADVSAYMRTFRQSSPALLNNLSTRKKLDILFALNQDCFVSSKTQEKRHTFLDNNSDKLLALLNLQIPSAFWEDEMRKIRLITADIAKIPHIKSKLENFHDLSQIQQRKLFKQVSRITSLYNGIETPNLFLLTDENVKKFSSADWVEADAFAYERNIYINTDKLDCLSGIQCLSLAWHETNHVAQSYGNYSQYPIMEDILNPRLNYLNEYADVYIMHPQEKVNYALEKQFIEESVKRSGIKADERTFLPHMEYDIATQYMAKSTQRKY